MFQSEAAYDSFMGRFSTKLAVDFADFAGVAEHDDVLDVGAGTGALTTELVRRGAVVSAVEPSDGFVAALRGRFPDVDVRQSGAEELPWTDESFDAALAQLVVSFMGDPPAGLREMHRVVRSGGTVAACMWAKDDMELLDAINRTRIALGHETFARRYPTAEALGQLVGSGAELDGLLVEASYSGFDDLWNSLLGGAGPDGAWVASLDDEQRIAARAELYNQVGEPDGPFTLTGRAWAARATRA